MKPIVSLMIIASLTSSVILLPSDVRAQECVDLARVMSRETERSASKSQINIVKKANFCSSKYEGSSNTQKAQIEASYGLFSGGASGSAQQISQKQEQECGGQFGSYWSDQVNSSDFDRVSQVGADVIRGCLQTKSFRLHSLVIQGTGIEASFTNGTSSDVTINGVYVTPEGIATCRIQHDGKNITDITSFHGQLKANNDLSLICTRKPHTEGTIDHYLGGIIGVSTPDGTASVPLVEYAEPPITEKAADSIKASIASLKASVDAIGIIAGNPQTCDWNDTTKYEWVCSASCPAHTMIAGGTCEMPNGTAGNPIALHESKINDGKWSCHYLNTNLPSSLKPGTPPLQIKTTALCFVPKK